MFVNTAQIVGQFKQGEKRDIQLFTEIKKSSMSLFLTMRIRDSGSCFDVRPHESFGNCARLPPVRVRVELRRCQPLFLAARATRDSGWSRLALTDTRISLSVRASSDLRSGFPPSRE